MKLKKIKVGIKALNTVLDDFVRTGESIERGGKVKKETGIYFTSFEAFRRALTPERLEILHIIKRHELHSVNELAALVKRNISDVSDDVEYLKQVGLIETKRKERMIPLIINYDRIALEIAV